MIAGEKTKRRAPATLWKKFDSQEKPVGSVSVGGSLPTYE
jgi:hypothetical protein